VNRSLTIVLLLALLPIATSAQAAGLTLREQSAVAQGRALAVVAKLDDPSTGFFNPAGIAFLEGFQAQVNATTIIPGFTWQDPAGVEEDVSLVDPTLVVPAVHITARLMDKVAVGLSVTVPYGLTLKYPDDWVGNKFVQETELVVPLINPNVSFQVADGVAIAIGAFVAPSSVKIVRPTVTLDASGVGVGGSFGVQAHLDNLHLGLAYQSRFKLPMEGTADNVDDELDGPVTSDITLPDVATLGVGYDLSEQLYAEFDVNYTGWSTIDELAMKFPDMPFLDNFKAAPQNPAPLNWEDSLCYRLGFEWKAPTGWVARLGGGYDLSPATDKTTMTPMVPDANRTFFTVGAGFDVADWHFDTAYLFTLFDKAEVSSEEHVDGFGQKYENTAHLISVAITWAGLGDERTDEGDLP
jgi:long-chain fatty acid transport protein